MKSKLSLTNAELGAAKNIQEAIKKYLESTDQKIMFLDSSGRVVSEVWAEGLEYFVVSKDTKLLEKL